MTSKSQFLLEPLPLLFKGLAGSVPAISKKNDSENFPTKSFLTDDYSSSRRLRSKASGHHQG
jgi:hypothetical protein